MVFSDFECPYCGRFARDVFPKIKAHYIDSGKLQLVFRHLPLTQLHPNAQIAAEMSECAASRGAFWRVHDALFALTASGGLDEKALAVVARGAGLSPQDLAACSAQGSPVSARLAEDREAAAAHSISGTPTFLIGEKVAADQLRVVARWSGAGSWDKVRGTIESAMGSTLSTK
jgi:protein-disulfide isomerase